MAIARERFTENSSGFIRAQIVDQDGEPVPESAITAASLTLYDLMTYVPSVSPAVGIINSRDAQDINAAGMSPASLNDVTYLDNGYFRWDLQPEDNIIVTSRRQLERHRAEFNFAFDGGSFNYQIEIEVVNLRKAA
jgi:hypothetical protein